MGLSVTQEYLLLALGEDGILPEGNIVNNCIIAGELIELLGENCKIEENKLKLANKEPADAHLTTLYNIIKELQPIDVDKALEHFNNNIDKIKQELVRSLHKEKHVTLKKVKLSQDTLYIPDQEDVQMHIQQIKYEMLEDTNVTATTLVVTYLLERNGAIYKYITHEEYEELMEKVNAESKALAMTLDRVVEIYELVSKQK